MSQMMILAGLIFVAILLPWLLTTAVRYIPNSRVGVVEKLVSLHGSIPSGFIALKNEAGFQPEVLRGGFHLMWPFIYRVHRVPLVTIPQGQLGYVFARDGQSLPPTQSLASNARVSDFHDLRLFLSKGGQRGPQRFVLREGTHAINLAQFVVLSKDRVYSLPISTDAEEELMVRRMSETIAARSGFNAVIISEDKCGIVTVHDGPTLEQGETYNRQEIAAVKERELREAEQRARQQSSMTESELSIVVQTNQGKAEYQRSLQQAAQIRALAEAEAAKIRALAEAEADKTARIGVAQAIAMEEQVRAHGGPQFQVVQHVMNRLAEAVERSGADVVPKVVVSSGSGGATGGLLEIVMTLLMSEKLGLAVKVDDGAPRDKDVTALRDRIRRQALGEERPLG